MIIQYRDVIDFQSVVFRGPGQLQVVQAEQDSLRIEAAGNYLDQITSRVNQGTLEFGLSQADVIDLSAYNANIRYVLSVRDLRSLKVLGRCTVVVPDIDRDEFHLSIQGRADVTLAQLTADQLHARISGPGRLTVNGDVEFQTLHINGAGKLHAEALICDQANVRLTDAARAELKVNDELHAYISEGSKLGYLGYPEVEKYGAGTLVRRRKAKLTTRGTEHG